MGDGFMPKRAIIFHENIDFVRDMTKYLARSGWSCVCLAAVDRWGDIGKQNSILIIDVNLKKRHHYIADRVLRSKKYKIETLVVNAAGYEKNDWQKIKVYADMMKIRHKLLSQSDWYRDVEVNVESGANLGA